MIFKTLNGSQKRVQKPKKYLVDWGAKSRSNIQFATKAFLESFWKDHVVFEEFPVAGTRLRFDFYNANKQVAVEVHGAQHTKFVPFFHKRRSGFVSQLRRDQQKVDFCELNKIRLVEIYKASEINKKTFEDFGVFL
jgi:hypothetical protein